MEIFGVPALSKLKKTEAELKQKNNKIKWRQLETQKQLMKQKITKIASAINLSKRKIDSLNLFNQSPNLWYTYKEQSPEIQIQSALYDAMDEDNNTTPKVFINSLLQKNTANTQLNKEDTTVAKQIEIILTDKKGKQKKIVIQLEKE